jgi:hypothetical protein
MGQVPNFIIRNWALSAKGGCASGADIRYWTLPAPSKAVLNRTMSNTELPTPNIEVGL